MKNKKMIKKRQQPTTEREIAYHVLDRISFLVKFKKGGAEEAKEIKTLKTQLAALENAHTVIFDSAGFNTRCRTLKSIEKAFEQYKKDFYIKALGLENIESRAARIIFHPLKMYSDSIIEEIEIFENYYYTLEENLNNIIKSIELPQRFRDSAAASGAGDNSAREDSAELLPAPILERTPRGYPEGSAHTLEAGAAYQLTGRTQRHRNGRGSTEPINNTPENTGA